MSSAVTRTDLSSQSVATVRKNHAESSDAFVVSTRLNDGPFTRRSRASATPRLPLPSGRTRGPTLEELAHRRRVLRRGDAAEPEDVLDRSKIRSVVELRRQLNRRRREVRRHDDRRQRGTGSRRAARPFVEPVSYTH